MGNKAKLIIIISITFYQFIAFGIFGDTLSRNKAPDKVALSTIAIVKADNSLKGFRYVCSGTIIDKSTILTAAHCFDDRNFNAQVIFKNIPYNAKSVHINKKYKRTDLIGEMGSVYDIKIENDFALINLNISFKEKFISRLPTQKIQSTKHSKLFASGFGHFANQFGMGEGAGVLRTSISMHYYSATKDRIRIEDPRTGSCQGDSGGPVWQELADHSWVQIGITSQGDCQVLSMVERINLRKINKYEYYNYFL